MENDDTVNVSDEEFLKTGRIRKKIRVTIKYTLRSGGPCRKILRPKAEVYTED